MSSPDSPLRLQVVNRFVAVLEAITAGSNYFYTPYEVVKRIILPEETNGTPTYMVIPEGGGNIEFGGTELYDETLRIVVHGIVADNVDIVTRMERAIRDIRKAINDDSKSGTPGSLSVLCVQVRILEPPETDGGAFSVIGKGYFAQPFEVTISGDFGEL